MILLIIIAVAVVGLSFSVWLLSKYCDALKQEIREKNDLIDIKNALISIYDSKDPDGIYLDEWHKSKDLWEEITGFVVSFYYEEHGHPPGKTHPLITHFIEKYKIQKR